MRTPPLLADFTHPRSCIPFCEKYLTLPRNGKSYCSSHRIHEELLDAAVQEFAQTMRIRMAEEQKELKQKQKMWALRKPILDAHIFALQEKIQKVEQEVDLLTMSKIEATIEVFKNRSDTEDKSTRDF